LVECVITLPIKLFYNTGAPGCLIFLNKNKPSARREKVIFIYAAEGFEKLKSMNRLQDEDVKKIVKTCRDFTDVEKYAKLADLDTIRHNDWNLSPTRYVDVFSGQEPEDVSEVWRELSKLDQERRLIDERLKEIIKELGYGD
jgi:type I restriction enzyme M protein